MKQQTIHLNESQFNNLIKECVKQILKEGHLNFGDYSFLYEKFPVGGQITYHSKNGTTGGKLQKIFPLDGENMLVFAWANNRGLAINDGIRETNALLPQHKSYKPKAKLVGNDGDGWKTIDEGGYAVYENPQDNLHERTASEEGMTDDEVRAKRTQNFIKDTNWQRNIHDNPADDNLFLAGKDRYRKHLDTQKGNRFTKKAKQAYKTGKI
ncbi:MAG: hypothetical protein J6X18_13255 [Bacteroidales bacterium]|nr:hypothetical protein [Bacteroidales bacterium]